MGGCVNNVTLRVNQTIQTGGIIVTPIVKNINGGMTAGCVIKIVGLVMAKMNISVFRAMIRISIYIGLGIDVSKNAETVKTWVIMSVMMEIQLQGMDVVLIAKLNLDGTVAEARTQLQIHAMKHAETVEESIKHAMMVTL